MIIQSSWEVTSPEILLRKGVFHPLGLFSEQIFGPRKDYKCQCGKLQGQDYLGKRCDECNVLVGPSMLRRYTVSRIRFPFPIVHPFIVMFLLPPSLSNLSTTTVSDPSHYQNILEYMDKHAAKFEAFKKRFPLFIDFVYVIPPTLRPVTLTPTGKVRDLDRTNYFYLNMLNLLSRPLDDESEKAVDFAKLSLVKLVVSLYRHLIQKLTKKEGLIRQNVLGKRNDFTGRSVIVSDPTLGVDEARIPYRMLAALFHIQLISELMQDKDPIIVREMVSRFISNPSSIPLLQREEIKRVLDRLCAYYYVFLNRQPTLHMPSIRAFKPIGTDKDSIGVPMLVTKGYNADYDGDSVVSVIDLRIEGKEYRQLHLSQLKDLVVE